MWPTPIRRSGRLATQAAEHAVALAALTVDVDDRSRELDALLNRLAVYEQVMEHGRHAFDASVLDRAVAMAR